MIILDAGKQIYGVAGTANQLSITLDGMELSGTTETYKTLSAAGAQLASSVTSIYTASGVTAFIRNILICNIDTVNSYTFSIYVGGSSLSNKIYSGSVPNGGAVTYNACGWTIYDYAGNPLDTALNNLVVSIGTGTLSGGQLQWAGGKSITLSQNSNSVTVSAINNPNILTIWDNMGTAASTSTQAAFQRPQVFPMMLRNVFPGNMTVNSMLWDMSGSYSTTGAAQTMTTGSVVLRVGVYTWNAGTLSLLNSASAPLFTAVATTFSMTQSVASQISGVRWAMFTSNHWSAQASFTPGHYWIAWYLAGSYNGATSVTAVTSMSFNFYGQSLYGTLARSGTFAANSVTNNTTKGMIPFMGVYTATTNVFPNAINKADLNAQSAGANFIPHILFNNATGDW